MRRRFLLSQNKKVKGVNSIENLFCSQPLRKQSASGAWSRDSGPTKLLPRQLHSTCQHQATRALNYVCERPCFILIYFVHPWARCLLRYQKRLRGVFWGVWEHSKIFLYKLMTIPSSFYAFWLMKVFTERLYLQIAGETFILLLLIQSPDWHS